MYPIFTIPTTQASSYKKPLVVDFNSKNAECQSGETGKTSSTKVKCSTSSSSLKYLNVCSTWREKKGTSGTITFTSIKRKTVI